MPLSKFTGAGTAASKNVTKDLIMSLISFPSGFLPAIRSAPSAIILLRIPLLDFLKFFTAFLILSNGFTKFATVLALSVIKENSLLKTLPVLLPRVADAA